MMIASVAWWLLVVILTLLTLWAIIRGAVLSALRKHDMELREAQQVSSSLNRY
ncbi:hypothetical protein [Microterricola viridarii]|uniref:Uncharacterized protein n=1 Tax=Microterricola viridarii TaxID=412690 RepID=A0A1H1YHP8_9MICO|nr:hypothetical protein [Microterricola viridarii]SDT21010.1 hypothetical protein SAMN04489834_3091 [Microterricola viridarii]